MLCADVPLIVFLGLPSGGVAALKTSLLVGLGGALLTTGLVWGECVPEYEPAYSAFAEWGWGPSSALRVLYKEGSRCTYVFKSVVIFCFVGALGIPAAVLHLRGTVKLRQVSEA